MTKSPENGPVTAGGPAPGTPVLELTDVVIHYGRIKALHGISLRARGTWTRGYLDAFVGGRPTKRHLSRANPARMQLALRWTEPTESMFWGEVELDLVRKQTRLAPGDVGDTQRIPPGGTPGYALWHLRLGANLLDERLRASVGLENVFDQDYRIHGSGTNGPGRRLVFAVQLRW